MQTVDTAVLVDVILAVLSIQLEETSCTDFTKEVFYEQRKQQ